jgi:hypothetical protein
MMRRSLIAALVISLSIGPAFAQTSSPGPIRRSISEVTFQQTPPAEEEGITPAFKWTGIGLLIGGGSSILAATVIDDEDCDDLDSDITCDDVRTGLAIFGAVAAGTGAALLFIGKARADKKKASPEILPTRRGVLVRTRFSF